MKSVAALLLVAAVLSVSGQTNHWREFRKTDGLPEDACVSVTIGARGNLYVSHPPADSISVLDGYAIAHLPAPDATRGRIYESPGGQLWSPAEDGLWEFRAGQWVKHFVPEIATGFQAGCSNALPLCPVRQGELLVLLPDRLLQVQVVKFTNTQVRVIRHANQGQLGAFTALAAADDGGLWISGERGVAKISGPLRDLTRDSEWTELAPPAELRIQNFGAAQEDAAGDLTVLAESAGSRAPVGVAEAGADTTNRPMVKSDALAPDTNTPARPRPVLVRYAAQRWIVRNLSMGNPRFAWHVSGEIWIVTDHSLWELSDNGTNVMPNREISGCNIFDAAGEPGGAFWLATSDGLFRHAPSIWETPARGIDKFVRANPTSELPDKAVHPPDGHWTAFLATQNGDRWLGGAHEIAWWHEKRWRSFSSTNQYGPENTIRFAEAPDGRIWCATPDKVWEFDGKGWLETRGGFDHVNDLHCARNGALWVATDQGLWRLWRGAWIANGPEDGLASGIVREIAEDPRGEVWANTPAGWSVFNPEADTDPPETFLRTAADANQSVREGNRVTFMFAGRDKWNYTDANRLLFSWRLDEREWSPFQEPVELGFNDLPVGKHLFQVRALDRNGNLEPKPARLEFTVYLPWYRQPRLILILAIALAVAIFFAAIALNRHRRLQHSYADVEKRIAERTRELEIANHELLHSQKMNALGTLAAGIAHDFNNILSIIKGSAQIIEANTGNPQKIKTRLDRIKTVVQQGAEIVDAMLGFSRGSDSPAAPCDLNTVIADTLKLLGDRFLRETEIRFERGENLPEISAPKDFIQQILLNFIFNAAEAQAGRKQITLATRTLPEPPPEVALKPAPAPLYILISVRDRGGGIAPEIKSRIFEPFFTTKALSARRGTGLGLSMVYELAKKMGAGLAVESAAGQGSTFTLILPLRHPAGMHNAPDIAPHQNASVPAAADTGAQGL